MDQKDRKLAQRSRRQIGDNYHGTTKERKEFRERLGGEGVRRVQVEKTRLWSGLHTAALLLPPYTCDVTYKRSSPALEISTQVIWGEVEMMGYQ